MDTAEEYIAFTPLRTIVDDVPTTQTVVTAVTPELPRGGEGDEDDETVMSLASSSLRSFPSSSTYVPIKLEFPASPTRSVSSIKSEGRHPRYSTKGKPSRNTAGASKKKHVIKRKLRSSPLRSFPTKSTRMVWMEQMFVLE